MTGLSVALGDVVEVDVERVATGGEGVARAADGRTLFVAGALPGERVRATVTEVRKRHGRAVATDIVAAAPGRRTPPCPHVADGCGGCDWQHVEPALQARLRTTIVSDALERIGHVAAPPVEAAPPVVTAGRTTVRAAVTGGRAGYRRRGSHDVVVVEECRIAHPAVAEALVEGRFGGATEVLVRVGASTGERVVRATPGPTDDERSPKDPGIVHEEAGGRRWQVAARSFFQPSPEAADALVREVTDAVGPGGSVDPGATGATGRMVDLAAGVGLFAGTVGRRFAEVVAVEPSSSAVADARVNLADLGPTVEVVRSTIERWAPVPADVVVADPPRAGLGRTGVDRVVATGAGTVVLVSCDAASLGRDAGLLVAAGYRLERSRVLDLFPETSHVEVVSRFARGAR